MDEITVVELSAVQFKMLLGFLAAILIAVMWRIGRR